MFVLLPRLRSQFSLTAVNWCLTELASTDRNTKLGQYFRLSKFIAAVEGINAKCVCSCFSFSKLFLKHWHVCQLEDCSNKQYQAATVLQKTVRCFLQRKKYTLLLREKAEQEEAVKNLLMKVVKQLRGVTESLERMNDEDEKRLLGMYGPVHSIIR